jgi:hypothetical protein
MLCAGTCTPGDELGLARRRPCFQMSIQYLAMALASKDFGVLNYEKTPPTIYHRGAALEQSAAS